MSIPTGGWWLRLFCGLSLPGSACRARGVQPERDPIRSGVIASDRGADVGVPERQVNGYFQ